MNYELIDITKSNDKRNIDEVIGYNVYKANANYFKLKINIKLFDKHTPFILVKNKFPYHLKNAIHYVLWINPKYNKFYNKNKIVKIIRILFNDYEYKFWQNPISKMSLKYITHYHIIVKSISYAAHLFPIYTL
jgi:hypothetical protein